MNIAQMQIRAAHFGPDAAFVANVISARHRNRARKLRGLLGLLEAGHDVRTGQFDSDTLIVDGRCEAWAFLETAVAHFSHLHPEPSRPSRNGKVGGE